MNREVSTDEGEKFAKNNGMFFIETSALNSSNIEKAFEIVINQIYKKNLPKSPIENQKDRISLDSSPLSFEVKKDNKKKVSCCN